MTFDSTLQNSSSAAFKLPDGLTQEDIAALSNYPMLAKFFDVLRSPELAVLETKFNNTFQALDRVILRGSNDDAKQAKIASNSIKIVVEFLEMMKQMQQGGKLS